MLLRPECIPCLVSQALRTVNVAGVEAGRRLEALRRALLSMAGVGWASEPPVVYFRVFKELRRALGVDDPYRREKERCDAEASRVLDRLRPAVESLQDPFYGVVKLSIAGNMIDFGALESFNVEKALSEALRRRLAIDHYGLLRRALERARSLMLILDNAGESVLDKALLEEALSRFGIERAVVVVREEPFINDVTLEDARRIGIDSIPGVEIWEMPVDYDRFTEYSSRGVFRRWFEGVDVVIAKGQGNYEIFSRYRGVFFALVSKCRPVADSLGTAAGDMILLGREATAR
ncbi:hypothetical protein B6U99_01000 [Candidatus Geothermarchaeota archaeon ex4572_27]|nr:MAG: hypothetical protein B6U99_01000 [Candidatus Geothermarchaeota archaeon ex4572_27]